MENKTQKPLRNWFLFGLTIVVVFVLGMLASSVTKRKAEAEHVFKPQVQIADWEPRNEVWGKNYQREYQSYIQTADTTFRSKYGGNATRDMLEENPRLVVLFAGYGFSKDYKQGRGHYYALKDIYATLRTGAPTSAKDGPMPSTCWSCKSTDVARVMANEGIAQYYTGKWSRLGSEIVNPIGCSDCHEPQTMNLRITRPALAEAWTRMGRDINKATHQEMRSLVCAQCHVEYFFDKSRPDAKDANYLTFPWDNGFTVEAMENYYDSLKFSDWTHAISKAPMLKAQHPDYEVFMTGIHAQRGVSCADCHMPYKSEGGQKFTDHHIQSPLNNVANSCQVCHRQDQMELLRNVYDRQDKITESRGNLEQMLVHAHVEAKKAWDLGAKDDDMKPILQLIRQAQWRWDYAAAGHGSAFHAPVETGRVISNGIVKAQEARLQLARLIAKLGHNEPIAYPDIATKEKAQLFIGLDPKKMAADKKKFMDSLLPIWLNDAQKRQDAMPINYTGTK